MKSIAMIRLLFVISGLYDVILGLAFLVCGAAIFDHFNVTQPNHPGYMQFPALLLIIFGLMFFAVASNPVSNHHLIPYGILLKFSYSGIVFYYWLTSGVPTMWKPFAVADLAFAALFIWSWVVLCPKMATKTDMEAKAG